MKLNKHYLYSMIVNNQYIEPMNYKSFFLKLFIKYFSNIYMFFFLLHTHDGNLLHTFAHIFSQS